MTNPRLAGTARVVVISPHLDDGVLSCGDLLAQHPGSSVITIFAGRPDTYPSLTAWDRSSGFEPWDDAVLCRQQEDETALRVLHATPCWLPFLDAQYGGAASVAEISSAIGRVLAELSDRVVVTPLGLYHSDHVLASDAALAALPHISPRAWYLYEDALYRATPGAVAARVAVLQAAGIELEPAGSPPACSERKCTAVAAYRSQLRALRESHGGYADVFQPEGYWRLISQPETLRAGRA